MCFYLKCQLAKRLHLLAVRQVNSAFLLKLLSVLFRYFLAILFETIAYNHGAAANVVVVLMASAAISALFLGGSF